MRHGKWWDRWHDVPVDKIMEGRFDRLFDPAQVPAAFDDADLQKLAAAMTAKVESPPTPEDQVDSEENTGILAIYTYLGQFIDHDITFDPTSHLRKVIPDLNALVDFRTPRLDLDSLYGRGPGDQPYLYSDGIRLLAGRPLSGNPHDSGTFDLPRGPSGRALIGDPRNDENRIVAQLHATMLRFHNRMADLMPDASFEEVRDQVRWHYQWVVINDFLPTIINQATVQEVFPHLANGTTLAEAPPKVTIGPSPREARNSDGFFMPVEFSVAAYRFGHSMIRPIYRLNESISRRPIFSAEQDAAADLGGMRPIPDDWGIDWQFFVDIGHGIPGPEPNSPDDPVTRKPQHAYKIDTSIVGALAALPPVVATNPSSLAERNLLRGRDFGLPSGETVAAALDEPVTDVVIGKATDEDPQTPIGEISEAFVGNAPLWAYILSEAQVTSWANAPDGPKNGVPIRLGPVGGKLVAEVFAAMLLADRTSFLNAAPQFTPQGEFMQNNVFGITELINAALEWQPQG